MLGGLDTSNVLLTVLEAKKGSSKALAGSGSGEGLCSSSQTMPSAVFPHGRSGQASSQDP